MDIMPGSMAITKDEVAINSQDNVMGICQQSSSSVILRTPELWQEKDGSTSIEVNTENGKFIPTRTVEKNPKLHSHNPLQFVKVQSPLYIKAEEQIKLTKEVKLTREALKEGEEEWQSNLDNWKSRRRKVSEKVLQRAEEMRQIEAEEQLRQEKLFEQQRKIKKFSEIVEKRSRRNCNLDLYISQEDDSGLGGTPEPDDTLDCQTSLQSSDTSEEMSESDSNDSDLHNYNKNTEELPLEVPQRPYSRFRKSSSLYCDANQKNCEELIEHSVSRKDNFSIEQSDIEGQGEATSSEDDVLVSGLDSLSETWQADSILDLSQDSCISFEKSRLYLTSDESQEMTNIQIKDGIDQSIRLTIKPGDVRGFGFMLTGGKDQGGSVYIENIFKVHYLKIECRGLICQFWKLISQYSISSIEHLVQ